MTQVVVTTWKDILDHLVDFLGSNASREVYKDARRASLAALRDFSAKHRWTYYYARGRLNTVAPYNGDGTGTTTVAYDHTGGIAPRVVTLVNGTWPAWAASPATLQMTPSAGGGPIEYEVESRLDDNNITLTAASNPGADTTASTDFFLWLDAYSLPVDWLAFDQMMNATLMISMQYVHPSTWLAQHRHTASPGTPHRYTVMGDPAHYGGNAIRFFPAPDNVYAYDYIYQRRPRPLLIDGYATGTVAATGGGNTVTGTKTAWTSKMVGSVFRFGSDATNVPTGMEGLYPFAEERIITDVASATALTLDAALSSSYSGVAYAISDPLDIEEGAMLTAYLRCAEMQLGRSRTGKDRAEFEGAYRRALAEAREADSRNFGPRRAGEGAGFPNRLAYMPRGPDLG